MDAILKVTDVTKTYLMGEVTITALAGVSFSLYEGEFVVVLGPSGSGKSTMLNIIGGIDSPSSGEIEYMGGNLGKDGLGRDGAGYISLGKMSQRELTFYRRNAVGFVFQFYNLIPNLTARENIQLACDMSKTPIPADELLDRIGMGDRGGHFPSQLSGGQQQRIAIARALGKNPHILLCDEPTGALDVATGIGILKLLRDFNKSYGKTVAIITHNSSIAGIADRVFHIRDGKIDRIIENSEPIEPEDVVW
ncbi:MAG: ABC transporter ATP-binding protein [Oscillospiraceae bacterium]|nr:ABC transporter ATP-binding protein [Oscillospiraceae bacterium]